jgi:hypothetical protein
MAITITTALKVFNPVRNPIEFKVTASSFDPGTVTRPGSVIIFDPADMPQDGDTMTLTSDVLGDPLVLTFRNTPAYNSDEVPAYVSGGYGTYVLTLALAIRTIYEVNTNYFAVPVTAIDPYYGVFIGARTLAVNFEEAVYSADQNITVGVSGFTLFDNQVTSASSFELPANAAIIFQLEATTDNPNFSPSILLEEAYTPDRLGTAMFDPSDVLRSILAPYIPDSDISTHRSAYSAFTSFRIFSCERYGDPSDNYPLSFTDDCYAYLAGRNEARRIDDPDWEDEVIGSPVDIRFLNMWDNRSVPTMKMVMPEQCEYLTWLYPSSGITSIKVKCDIYYESGDPTLAHVLDTVSAKYYHLLVSPIGHQAVGIDALDSDRRVQYYRVYLTNGSDTVISEYRYYELDYRHHEWTEQMLWFSSTGGVECVALHGARSRTSMVETITSGRYARFPATQQEGADTVSSTRRIESTVEQGTMYLREHEMPVLADLIGSEAIRVLALDGEWLPVESLAKRGVDLATDGDGIRAETIEYRIAHSNTAS